MRHLHPALLVLVMTSACLPTPAACEQRPPPTYCSVTELIGEWRSADGHRLRFVDSRDRGFSLNGHVVDAEGRVGPVLYRQVKPARGCAYSGWRRSGYRDQVPVRLSLNPAAGQLRDDTDAAAPRTYLRVPEAAPTTPRP